MSKPQHTHKLLRKRYKTGTAVYFCVHNCSFKIGVEFALGKETECWRCNKPFRMNSYTLRLARPHCTECHVAYKDNRKSKVIAPVVEVIAQETVSALSSRLDHLVGRNDEEKEEEL